MKKIKGLTGLITVICLCSICILGYWMIKNVSENKSIKNFTKLQMELKNITPSGATIIFTHPEPTILSTYATTEWSYLQKEVNGNWEEVDLIDTTQVKKDFTPIPFSRNGGLSILFEENWSPLYGNLSEGNYRLYKEISDPNVVPGGQRTTIMRKDFSIK